MVKKYKGIILYTLIYIILFTFHSFSATKLIIVAPGQQFTVGSGLSGIPNLQTIGVPFSVTVYSIDDVSNNYVNTNASVAMSANNIASFNPVGFTLTQTEGSVPTCKRYPVEITINMSSSGNITITATENGGLGLGSASVAIGAQKIDHFTFNNISTQTAGQSISLYISARDASNNTVTSFSGTASLKAYYSTGSYDLGTIQFTNGVYNGAITLYRATNDAEQVYIECKSTTPNVTSNSNNFSINPGPLDRLLIIGPGQIYEPGTLTGNGRVGGSEQISQQTAGVYFYVTVRACDAYWNTRTSESFPVTIGSTDQQAQFDSVTKNLSSGRAIFRVELRTAGYQYITVTATGVTYNSVTAPVTNSTLDHFIITTNITNKIAGQQFQIQAVAVDAFNNTVTTFTQTGVTLQAWAGSVQIDSNNWNKMNINFTNGIMSGSNGYVIIYQKAFNVFLRLIYGSAQGDSNQFTVNSGNYTRLIFIAPGQQPDPGDITNPVKGVTGNPLTTTAGATYGSVSIVAVDNYGNKVTTINNIVEITSTDPQATIYGQSLPQYLTLVAGEATFNMVFRTSGNRTVTGRDTQQSSTNATFSTNVYSSVISYFEISNIPSSITAGNAVTSIIRAKDEFGNTKTDWTGIVYLSSPYTDWELPYESTMAVTGTNTGQYQHKWAVTFTAGDSGQRSLTTYFYRAVTWQAKLFVSTNFNDTPLSYTGYIGESSGFTVSAGKYSKLQVIAPGMEARPGTADGENNTPSGQAKGQVFTVTINLCDAWWNVVKDPVHQINVTTNDPTNSEAGNPLSSSFPVSVWLSNGVALCPVKYNSESSTFKVIVSDVSDPTVTGDQSPNITIFEIYRIDITSLSGGLISDQVAGVPFWVSITAIKSQPNTVATGFNGVMELASSNNYSESEYTIEPTVSPQFVSGKCQVLITMYRASTTVEGGPSGGVRIKAKFSTTSGINESNTFNLWPSTPQKALIIVDGMTHKPGLTHVGIPFYAGYSGSPKIVKAGEGFDLGVYIVDQYYNIVYTLPFVSANLSSTDPYPASIDGINLPTNINIINGVFSTNNMVLKTVLPGYQQITAAPSGYGSAISPSIYVRHTALHHFDVLAPSGPIPAGEPFNITVLARDVYGNLCDDTNEPVPNPAEDSPDITLSEINLGYTNTIYPKNYKLSNGILIAPVQLFKKGNNQQIMVTEANGVTGISNSIAIDANAFKRLLVITQGMTPLGGVYTGDSPVNFTLYTGMPITRTVNDTNHSPSGYQFRVYSCDLYGNITATADVIGKTVTVTTNDPYAVPVTATTINSLNGEAVVNVIFHTAMAGVTVSAQITDQSILEFETPGFRTLPGDPYGLQLIVPGLYIAGGSGGPDPVTPTIWDNGVRGTESSQLSGVYFPVSVYACDLFGNTVSGVNDTVQITSGDLNPSAEPNQSSPKIVNLSNGFTWTTARLISSPGYINMGVTDVSNGSMNHTWKKSPYIYVTTSGQLLYRIAVNGEYKGDGTLHTDAVVYPSTFNMTVEVIDNYSPQPVFGVNRDFILTPVTVNNSNIPANGILGITSGSVFNGKFSTTNQTYTRAESIRIKVTDQLGEIQDATSCIINFSANPIYTTFTLRSDPAYIRSGTNSRIIARVIDINNNPVDGVNVNFSIESGAGTLDSTVATTNANGEAFVNYLGPYLNERAIIRGTYGYLSLTTSVSVSLVEPVPGEISNYPNPFKAGAENTNISFLLNEPAEVKLKIYSLFGDLVYSKNFSRQEIESMMNETGNVITISWDGKNNKGDILGNGGYICIVETVIDGQKKKLMRKIGISK